MIPAACAALAASVLFAILAPRLGGRLPPAAATRLLVPASLVVAGCTVFLLGVLAFTWVGQLPALAAFGEWSTGILDATDPIPEPVAVASFLLLAAMMLIAFRGVGRRIRALAAVYRTYRGWRPSSPLIVLDIPRVDAFTTPAPAGRVVVTAGLLRAVTPLERRVVLAHEHSHLNHRHSWWALAADLAAAFNPLLRPTATTVGHAIERWADEDAARAVGDRYLVARTLARVALLQHHAPALEGVTASATGGNVSRRAQALLAPPPPRRPLALAVLSGVLLVGLVATAAVEDAGDQLFDHAGPAHCVRITAPLLTLDHSPLTLAVPR
ncbi:MAG: M56 family metallopeptidase [Sciscionella sp.]